MGITRGSRRDHISNTPKQIMIVQTLGFDVPTFAHLPIILGEDRSKLSKRHGAKSVSEYKEDGYLPNALINYLSLLGWSPPEERKFYLWMNYLSFLIYHVLIKQALYLIQLSSHG